jgi:hypothetical protein
MLNYNVYKNLSSEDYLTLEGRLVNLEKKMSDMLLPLNWALTCPVQKNDALIIDFIIDESPFMGNLGLTFDDVPGKSVFSFYVTKTYVEGEISYFVKKTLYKKKEIVFFESSISQIVDQAIETYASMSVEYLKKEGS